MLKNLAYQVWYWFKGIAY